MMCDYRDALITDVQKDDSAMDKIEEVVNTNFLGLVHVTRKAYRLMEASNDYGIIINISSILGHGVPFCNLVMNVYPGTKAIVLLLF
jgi:short-subunit dehydrogenase